MATTNEDEIIEKRASSPIATSCLVVSAVALIAATAFALLEIGEYRDGYTAAQAESPNAARDIVDADLRRFRADAKDIIEKNTDGDEDRPNADQINPPADDGTSSDDGTPADGGAADNPIPEESDPPADDPIPSEDDSN